MSLEYLAVETFVEGQWKIVSIYPPPMQKAVSFVATFTIWIDYHKKHVVNINVLTS